MKEFKAIFSWEDYVELGLESFNTYWENDDDRRREVTNHNEPIVETNGRYFFESKKGWLEFIFDGKIVVNRWGFCNNEIGFYDDNEFKINRYHVEKIILYDEKPLEVIMMVLE